MKFADKITHSSKYKNYSRAELGEKLDTFSTVVGCYERAEMTPSIEVAAKIARELNAS